jgi:excisionase family DNA binding protein
MVLAVAEDTEWLTVADVAARLKITPTTVLRWIRDRRLPATKPGGDRMGYRIRADDLDRFIAEYRTYEPG